MSSILAVDDTPAMLETYQVMLETENHRLTTAKDGREALEKLNQNLFDLVLLDLRLPDIQGEEILEKMYQTNPDLPVIIVTGYGSVSSAVEMLKLGVKDYIEKPFDLDEMIVIVNKAIEESKLIAEPDRPRLKHCSTVIGESEPMQIIYNRVKKVAFSKTTVLILGESGTGKELVTRSIHDTSPRSKHPFIAVNCAALAENLLESELFGYVKGAFTGATKCKQGLFLTADKGTLFLDEIGSLTFGLQAKLLRALEENEIRPVGGTKGIPIDVRIVAATNVDLAAAVEAGTFRKDLYYRLNVFPIDLPPLRERKGDIPLLVNHFLKKYAQEESKTIKRLSSQTLSLLSARNWPGNVRELENVIQEIVLMSKEIPPSLEKLSQILTRKKLILPNW